jgi:hypothetical protein
VCWVERKPGGDSSVLDFLVLFDQAKRTKERAKSPLEYFLLIKEALLLQASLQLLTFHTFSNK